MSEQAPEPGGTEALDLYNIKFSGIGSQATRRERRLANRMKTSRLQRDPDHTSEIRAEVRLRQQQYASVEPAMMDKGVFGIA
jgi:hypothetical protein